MLGRRMLETSPRPSASSRPWPTAAPLCASLLLLLAPLPAQSTREMLQTDYYKAREAALFDASQRHLELGSWARKQWLVPQATSQFLRAVEVGEGRNQGAITVLGLMRGYGDAFWRGNKKKPPASLLADYERRATAIERQSRKARAELAQRAARASMADESRLQWLAVLRLGGVLDYDSKGNAKIDGEAIPAELADWLGQQTTKVNGGQRAFEAAGASAPRLEGLCEQKSDKLIVRTDLGMEQARALHALGTALWPVLQDRLDGAPTRPLGLYVFEQRRDYEAYLDARGLGIHKAARGLADYGTFQTLVCAEGLPDADLQAITLHELSHLFFFGTAPAFLPDWYAEGFAETFGGQGTFTWDGKTLQTGGPMARHRLLALQQEPLPLRELLAADAAALLAADQPKGLRFYAEAWALQRFLREDRNPWGARFLHWEAQCRGAVLGAPEGGRYGDTSGARAVFDRLFSSDLDQLEAAFGEWLAKL